MLEAQGALIDEVVAGLGPRRDGDWSELGEVAVVSRLALKHQAVHLTGTSGQIPETPRRLPHRADRTERRATFARASIQVWRWNEVDSSKGR